MIPTGIGFWLTQALRCLHLVTMLKNCFYLFLIKTLDLIYLFLIENILLIDI